MLNSNYEKVCKLLLILSLIPFSLLAKENIQQEKNLKEAQECFKKIQHVKADRSYEDYEDKNEWWEEVVFKTRKLLRKCLIENHEGIKVKLNYFFQQFEKCLPQDKLKFLLGGSEFLLTTDLFAPHRLNFDKVGNHFKNIEWWKRLKRVQLQASKIQVRLFLKNKELFESYYKTILWTEKDCLVGHLMSNKKRRLLFIDLCRPFLKPNDERSKSMFIEKEQWNWGCARDFMLIAHAMGRDDLLEVIEPEKLYNSYERWIKWIKRPLLFVEYGSKKEVWVFKENESFFKFFMPKGRWYVPVPPLTIPKLPFQSWNGIPPPNNPHSIVQDLLIYQIDVPLLKN